MNPKLFPLLLLALGVSAAIPVPTANAQEKNAPPVTLAVLDFDSSLPDKPSAGKDASVLLASLLSAQDGLQLVERADLEKLLGETELALSGAVTPDGAAKIAQLTGARLLVTGRLFSADGTTYAVTKVISTENSRVFGQTRKSAPGESYTTAVEALAGEIAAVIGEKKAELLREDETREEKLTRLRAAIAGKALPSVYVNIPEEHISRRIPDPAAQTEIQKLLQDVGFPLAADSQSAGVIVTGEAFSEAAGRRGNLVSCRARVEVKVSRKAAPDRIQVDRQAGVALDLAENMAAKTALQHAGGLLAERLVPLLAQ